MSKYFFSSALGLVSFFLLHSSASGSGRAPLKEIEDSKPSHLFYTFSLSPTHQLLENADPSLNPQQLYDAFGADSFPVRYAALQQASIYAKKLWEDGPPAEGNFFNHLNIAGLNKAFSDYLSALLLYYVQSSSLSISSSQLGKSFALLGAKALKTMNLPSAPHMYDQFTITLTALAQEHSPEAKRAFTASFLQATQSVHCYSPYLSVAHLNAQMNHFPPFTTDKKILEKISQNALEVFQRFPQTQIKQTLKKFSFIQSALGQYESAVEYLKQAMAMPSGFGMISAEDTETKEEEDNRLFVIYLDWLIHKPEEKNLAPCEHLIQSYDTFQESIDRALNSEVKKNRLLLILSAAGLRLADAAQKEQNHERCAHYEKKAAQFLCAAFSSSLTHLAKTFLLQNVTTPPAEAPPLKKQEKSQSVPQPLPIPSRAKAKPSPRPNGMPTIPAAPANPPSPPAELFLAPPHPSSEKWSPPPAPKEKIKTRGTPTPQPQETKPREQPSATPQEKRLIAEELLKGEPYHIFHSFFESAPKISLDDTKKLLAALQQDVDGTKGKGSHTKATLSFGLSEEKVEKLTVILAHHGREKLLKPYQVLQLRDIFLHFGLFPRDMERQLIDKKLLPLVSVH